MSAAAAPPPGFPEEGTGWNIEYSVIAREDFSMPVIKLADASEAGDIGSLETQCPISGSASFRGTSNGSQGYQHYFNTRSSVLPLRAGTRYRLTFSYTIVAEEDNGFEAIFYSPTGGQAGRWLDGITLHSPVGASGVADLEATLLDFPDYMVWLNVVGKGAIVVDDIKLFEGDRVVFEEDFEKHGKAPGPGVQITGGSVDEMGWLLIENGHWLSTDPNIIVLPKLSTCRISFDYKVLAPTIDDRTLDLRLSPYPGAAKSVELRPLLRNAEASGRFSTGFSTGSAGPYAISFSSGRQARILIDNILIEQGTPKSFTEEPASYEHLENAPFPRLGNYISLSATEQVAWGGIEGEKWRSSVEAVERRLALYDLIVGFNQIQNLFDSDFSNRIKAINPNVVLLPYVIGQEALAYTHSLRLDSLDPDGTSDFRYDLNLAEEWFVKDSNGVFVNDLDYPGILKLDISPTALKVGGKSFLDYQVERYRQDYFGSGIWDGLFIDNLFARMNGHIPNAYAPEKLDFDINRNGRRDETPALLNRISLDGERSMLERLIANVGNRELLMGNNGPIAETRFAPYVNGYVFENFGLNWNGYGGSGNINSELGWRRTFDNYMYMDKNCRSPKTNVVEALGWIDNFENLQDGHGQATGSDILQNRFSLSTALLGGAYYEFDLSSASSAIAWFDEFTVEDDGVARESVAGKGYLGKALGSAVELANPARKLWEQNFEGFGAGGSGSGEGSSLTRKSDEIIAGKRSLIIEGKTRRSDAWPSFSTIPDSFNLRKGKTYVFEFSWKVLKDIDYGLWFTISNEREQFGTQIDALFTGESGRIRYPFTPLEDGDYNLRFSILSAGKIAIDDIRITEGGAGPWRRDFENGIVLVNPYRVPAQFDAGAIAGALGRTGVKRIKGTQAPEINTGVAVGDLIVLGPFDAIILLADHKEAH